MSGEGTQGARLKPGSATRNGEIVRSAFEASARGDLEGWSALSSPDVEDFPRREEPGVKGRYVDWDGRLEYVANWHSGWATYTVEPERFIECGGYE